MISETKLIQNLQQNIKLLEHKIQKVNLYCNHKMLFHLIINSKLVLERCLPFILSTTILTSIFAISGDMPFKKDKIIKNSEIDTIDTSNGIHREYVIPTSKNFLNFFEIQYTTGWKISPEGIYERELTTYKIDDTIEFTNKEIFEKSQKELQEIFKIKKIENIKKEYLLPEDMIYNEDMIIITEKEVDKDLKTSQYETDKENFIVTLNYLAMIFLWGNINRYIINYFDKGEKRKYLKNLKSTILDPTEIDQKLLKKELLESLKLQKENLSILTEDDLLSKQYSKSLRKSRE